MQLLFSTAILVVTFEVLLLCTTPSLSLCRDACGAIQIKYPFGLDNGCGAPEYRAMFNCSAAGELFFATPSGQYRVRSVDYDKHTLLVFDPSMSTCTLLQPRHDFALSDLQFQLTPPSSASAFALLNCSLDSPVLNHYRSLCFNFSGHSCDELYGTCSSFRVLRPLNGTFQPGCCFTEYATLRFMNLNILDCTHYTTIYGIDDLKGVGPLDWTYGMELSYAVPDAGCEHCEETGGTCGYNTETNGSVCMCSGGGASPSMNSGALMNTSRDCGKVTQLCSNAQDSSTCATIKSGGQIRRPTTLMHVLILILGSIMGINV